MQDKLPKINIEDYSNPYNASEDNIMSIERGSAKYSDKRHIKS